MDRLQSMLIFTRVADLGSFTQAAEQLQMPRPTVSTAVQELEDHLRVRLLHRTTRKVALTEEGTAYYERCVRVLADIDDAEALFSGVAAGPRGVVRVDLPERLALHTVIPALPQFFRQYPDIRLVLSVSDRLVDLIQEGIDCVVRVGHLSDSSLVARRIGCFEQINCAARSYLASHGTPETPAELANHLQVGFFSSQTGRDLDWEYQAQDQVHYVKVPSQISVNSAQAYLACCQAGLGIIQAPLEGLAERLASGEFEEILSAWRPAPLPVSVLYPHGRHLAPRVRVFIEWVAQLLEPKTRLPSQAG